MIDTLRLAALALVAALAVAPAAAQSTAPELGYTLTELPEPVPAPAFTLKDMDGEPHALEDYRGKVVLLNFWATWCPPCVREMPSLERLYQEMQGEPFTVLAVNQFENPDHVFAWTGRLSVYPTFPIVFDPDSSVAEAFGVRGLPTTFLVDPEGRVRYRAIGGREFDHPEVVRLIQGLMGKWSVVRRERGLPIQPVKANFVVSCHCQGPVSEGLGPSGY